MAADGTIHTATDGGEVYAINPDGTQKWVTTPGGRIGGSPMVDADGSVYIGSRDANLYALDSQGQIKWSFATNGQVNSSPALGADGTLYFGSNDFKLYAVRAGLVESAPFTRITTGEITNDIASSLGASWGDYDNDGNLDLFVANANGENNFLYQNNGDGTFTRITEGDIVNDGGFSESCSWADIDNDGDLDLFVGNDGIDFLYQHNGDGGFTKITSGPVVSNETRTTHGALADYDNDGDLDLFITTPAELNILFNNNGDGTFTQVTEGEIVNVVNNSLGAGWGDLDNDGDLDLFVTNAINSGLGFPVGNNELYLNNGDGTFTTVTEGAIVNDGGDSIGSSWLDFDNDGDLDLFVANANVDGFGQPENPQTNFLYSNNGDGTFTRIVTGSIVTDPGISLGSAFADMDRDGDVDGLVANSGNQEVNFLYTNNGNANNWINIKLQGTVSNRSAIGAKVEVKTTINEQSVWQLHELSAQTGASAQNSLNAEFGLGTATTVDSVVVEWPSGVVQTLANVAANQFLTITETTGTVTVEPPQNATPGNNADINATSELSFQPTSTQLFFRRAGETTYQVTSLNQVGDNFVGTIPSDFVSIRGVEYYVSFSDGQSEVTFPQDNPINNPAILVIQVDQLQFQSALEAQTHKIISVPLILSNPEIDAVLQDDYGEYNVLPRQWRIFRFENDVYSERPNINAQFTPGTAFWLITRDGNAFDVEAAQSVNSSQPFEITIQPGWNQISTPFAFAVDWDAVAANGNVQNPVFFDGTEYIFNQTVVQPWEGYFVFNLESTPVTLAFPTTEATTAQQAASKTSPFETARDYQLQIVATIPGTKLRDSQNFLGFHKNASETMDGNDFLDPPPIGKYVRLSIEQNDLLYASNFKPMNGRGQEWDLVISSALPNQSIQITLQEEGTLLENFSRFILDLDYQTVISQQSNTFTVQLDKSLPTRRLKIILGTQRFAEQNDAGIPLMPIEFALLQNYPNPFNPETTIRYQIAEPGRVVLEIYNLLGQKVKTLVDEQKQRGVHTAQWDGEDVLGRSVSSGVYIYRLRSGELTAMRKLILVR